MSVNKVILIGNLGKDPEIRYTTGGEAVANFSIATNEKWKDKSGQKQEKTEWHNIVVWGNKAEFVAKHLGRGCTAYIEGSIQTRKWQDRDGKDRYTTEIKAFVVEPITWKEAEDGFSGDDNDNQKRGGDDGPDSLGF